MPSQNERVLARLRLGPVAAVEFQPPNVCDVGPPIWRVAARIDVLKSRGFVIRSERRSDGTASYTLVSEPEVQSDGPVVSSACGTGRGSAEARDAEFVGSSDTPEVSDGSLATTHASLFDPEPFVERGGYRDAA